MPGIEAVHDREHAVGVVRFEDGERNYLSPELLTGIADAYDELQAQGARAIVLMTPSKHFCAGAHFSGADPGKSRSKRASAPIYEVVPRLFERSVPVIAVINGAAIGGGLGLAMSADFRIAGPTALFSANFAQIGLSPGFGLTHTLPRAIGQREAARLFYTGRRIDGAEAVRIGVCDGESVTREDAESAAQDLAREIATSAPAAIRAIHDSLNHNLAESVRTTLVEELAHQRPLYDTEDFLEGVLAARERRNARFTGR